MAAQDPCVLGVDLGAGSLKATVMASDGTALGSASHAIRTHTPKFGWSEQAPEDWYQAFCSAVPRALSEAGVRSGQIGAIGFSAGAHIGVFLDAGGEVIRPALLWNDQRSAAEAKELHERAGDLIVSRSLNRANPTWLLPQILWLQRHEADSVRRVHRLFMAKDYLRYRVCGEWHTDFSDVVGALMADARVRNWSEELCALIEWPMSTLPPVVRPTDVVGTVTSRAAADAGLLAGTPVVCGSIDTTAESYGVGAVRAGQGVVKLATAGVLYLIVDHPSVNPPISCYPHILDGMYYTATGTNSCASAHRWLRDEFFSPLNRGSAGSPADTFSVMDEMASSVPAGSLGLMFHPYLQGERAPYWDPLLRGDFLGITMQHQRQHFVRALYEGIAFSIRDLKESAEALGQRFGEIRLIGGGSKSPLWRQIISDVLGLAVEQPRNGDASYAAALIAAVGIGVFASPAEAVRHCVRIVDRCTPDPARALLYSRLFRLYKDAQQALAPINHALHGLMG